MKRALIPKSLKGLPRTTYRKEIAGRREVEKGAKVPSWNGGGEGRSDMEKEASTLETTMT